MLVAAAMTAAAVFLLCAGGEKVQKVVRAEKFVLTGSDGKTRALLDVTEAGTGLVLYGPNGAVRAGLMASEPDGEPGIWVCDSTGRIRAVMSVTQDRISGMSLCDKTGRLRASLMISEDGSPKLGLFDQNERQLVALGVNDKEEPALVLHDWNGTVRVGLGVNKAFGSVMTLYSWDGKAVWGAP